MRNFKNILTMVVGSLSILFYTQIGSASTTGGAGADIGAAALTDRAASQTDGNDHSSKARVFLLCDAGTTSGEQYCQLYMQVLGGVTGVISDENDSSIAVSSGGAISATVYGSSTDVSAAATFAATDDVTGDLVAPPSGDTQLTTAMAISGSGETAVTLATTSSATENVNSASLSTITSITGDICRDFKSDAAADLYYANPTYTVAGGTNIDTKLAASSSNDAIFLLQGFTGAKFLRTAIGYAETFTIPYTITVTSNTAGTASTACD